MSTPKARRRAVMQELTREECGCGCPTCVGLLGAELFDAPDNMPTWYWSGPSPCRQEQP